MTRTKIEFKNSDGITLRGWLYTPDHTKVDKLPAIVMAHGFSALKEMTLDSYAEAFVANLPMCCLVYDHRGFGESDNAPGQPREEIVPNLQIADYSDAITYAATRPEINPDKIGVWGTSYSGGHVLVVAAVDRRVKVVMSQGPCVSGWDNFHRLVRPDLIPQLDAMFTAGGLLFSFIFLLKSDKCLTPWLTMEQIELPAWKAKRPAIFRWCPRTCMVFRAPLQAKKCTTFSWNGKRRPRGPTGSRFGGKSLFTNPSVHSTLHSTCC